MQTKNQKTNIRKKRVRKSLRVSAERPRLSVFRSNRHFYAQIIDDLSHGTIVAASTQSKELKEKFKGKNITLEVAQEVGRLIAKKAKEKNVGKVCLDRGPYLYHGRVKAFADAAREAGLEF
ncbi:MAG: 50S ribosomal protein L18 [Bdellovibrionales bacterium]|nr:50S ribosomal protein L18 [Bdellovibrionales bacterium]